MCLLESLKVTNGDELSEIVSLKCCLLLEPLRDISFVPVWGLLSRE